MADDESGGLWIPLESNPEVFNLWSGKAGLILSQAHFTDIYGLDEELLGMVPKPVKAVVLLFPIEKGMDLKKAAEDERIAQEGQPHLDNTIFWVKQTIGNACGTIGLIHALANSGVAFDPMSPLQNYIIECKAKTPLERAKALATTPLFAHIHAASAQSGQSAPPPVENSNTDLHFTCFVAAADNAVRAAAQGAPLPAGATQAELESGAELDSWAELDSGAELDKLPQRLIELDGRRAGPIDHGECTDLLVDVANLVKRTYLSSSRSVNFSMMALTEGSED